MHRFGGLPQKKVHFLIACDAYFAGGPHIDATKTRRVTLHGGRTCMMELKVENNTLAA